MCVCVRAQELAGALESGDADAFTAAVAEFDSLTRLDNFKTALLVSEGRVRLRVSPAV